MPWCDECGRFWSPNSMAEDGSCPKCGTAIAAPVKAPWHFKLMLVALALYLGWRAWQGIVWVAHHL